MKTTSIRNCQVCGKPFSDGDIVYFVPLDNNIVCPECAYKHDSREKRVFEGESTTKSLDKQIKLLQAVKFLLECPQDVIDSLDPDDRAKLCAKIKKSLGKAGGNSE